MDKITDEFSYLFINDDNIIGKWEYIDFVENIESDKLNQIIQEPYLTQLEFLPNGGMKIGTYNGELEVSSFIWTNGFIINELDDTCSSYIIENVDGEDRLYFEWKSGDYLFRGMSPYYYVLRRVKDVVV